MFTFDQSMTLVIVIFAFVLLCIIGLRVLGFNVQKQKQNKDNLDLEKQIDDRVEIYKKSFDEELILLQKEKRKIVMKNTKLVEKLNKFMDDEEEDDEEEDEEEEEDTSNLDFLKDFDIIPEKAEQYAKQLGLNPTALADPALQPLILEKLKENKELAITLGIIRPKILGATITQTPDTSGKSPAQIIIDTVAASGNMA